MVKKQRYRYRQKTIPKNVADLLFGLLERMGGSPHKSRLAALWENWNKVLGEDLAAMAIPLGSKGQTLVLRCDNAIQMQELHFLADDILERVNDFLQTIYFDKVHLTLAESGKNCLPDAIAKEPEPAAKPARRFARSASGKFLQEMAKDSPVARCYALFAGKKL